MDQSMRALWIVDYFHKENGQELPILKTTCPNQLSESINDRRQKIDRAGVVKYVFHEKQEVYYLLWDIVGFINNRLSYFRLVTSVMNVSRRAQKMASRYDQDNNLENAGLDVFGNAVPS